MKKTKYVRDEWRVLSNKFVRHHRLPHGTRVILEHKGTAGRSHGRKVRNDLTVTRRLFVGRANDRDTVTELFDKYLIPALTSKVTTRGLKPRLIGPNGEVANPSYSPKLPN